VVKWVGWGKGALGASRLELGEKVWRVQKKAGAELVGAGVAKYNLV